MKLTAMIGICSVLVVILAGCNGDVPEPKSMEIDDVWWVPVDALPPGSMGCPAPPGTPLDADANGDGNLDGWQINEMTDETGKKVEVICYEATEEYHLVINKKSFGKCPWPGGRNTGVKYAQDSDHNGVADDNDGDGVVDKFDWYLWVSWDGKLPGEPGVTHENYHDHDEDGLIDVNVYTYHGGQTKVTKRHFEVDWADDMNAEENEDNKEEFQPGNPEWVPDDFAAAIEPGEEGLCTPLDLDSLPDGITTIATETVTLADTSFTLPVSIENGWPIFSEADEDQVRVTFFPTKDTGTVSLNITSTLQEALGVSLETRFQVEVNSNPVEFEQSVASDGSLIFRATFGKGAMSIKVGF